MIKKNKTKTQEVYEELERLIVFCEIEPGVVLTETEVAEKINAGRTPVREALKMLEKDSLVSISRMGVSIPEVSGESQLKLLEVRRVILKLCVNFAIERLTPKDRSHLEEILEKLESTNNTDFFNWLRYKNKLIAEASKNQFIYEHLKNLQGRTHRFWYYYSTENDNVKRKILHGKIISAILDQNKEMGIDTVDNLIDYLEEFVKTHARSYHFDLS